MTPDLQAGPAGVDPISPVGPTVLARLGVDVYAPLASVRPTWRHLLPEAQAGGYFAAIGSAIERHEVAAGDEADQLRWLAEHIELPTPEDTWSFPYLNAAWSEAADQVGAAPARGLTARGNRALLQALLRLPAYRSRLADALTEAFRAELDA